MVVSANHLCWKNDDIEEKENIWENIVSFSLRTSLFISKLKVLIECVHIKKWNDNIWASFMQCFHSSGKNTHAHSMYT